MEIHKHIHFGIMINFNFDMVENIFVRGALGFRFHSVLVLLSIGNTPALRVTPYSPKGDARELLLYESLGILLLHELWFTTRSSDS